MSNDSAAGASGVSAVPFRLEVVVPIADFDRAKNFYLGPGWRVDAEAALDDGYQLMQLTPPGSNASIIFGTRVTAAQPGSFDGLLLVVDDIDTARDELLSRGVEVSGVFHDAGGGLGGGFHVGNEGRATGHDPERRSYASYASFLDTEGNRWVLQEITTRLPAACRELTWAWRRWRTFARNGRHHYSYEKIAPQHEWWNWYAAYMHARENGSSPGEASESGGRYMAKVNTSSSRRREPVVPGVSTTRSPSKPDTTSCSWTAQAPTTARATASSAHRPLDCRSWAVQERPLTTNLQVIPVGAGPVKSCGRPLPAPARACGRPR